MKKFAFLAVTALFALGAAACSSSSSSDDDDDEDICTTDPTASECQTDSETDSGTDDEL